MLRAPSVTDRKLWFFIKCDNAEIRILFYSFSSRLVLSKPYLFRWSIEKRAHIPFLLFFVNTLFFFQLVPGFNSKIYSFILHRSSFFWLLACLGCANAEFISWNNNLLHWKHVWRLCSHIAYLVLVPSPSKSLDWQLEFFDVAFWHLNRTNESSWCETAKRGAHQMLSGEQQKRENRNARKRFRRSNAPLFDIFIIAAHFKSISCVARFVFALSNRFLFVHWELETEKDNWWERRRYDNNRPISSIFCRRPQSTEIHINRPNDDNEFSKHIQKSLRFFSPPCRIHYFNNDLSLANYDACALSVGPAAAWYTWDTKPKDKSFRFALTCRLIMQTDG